MTFLYEFKKQAIKYLVIYCFISFCTLIGFYIDTKIDIGILKNSAGEMEKRENKNEKDIQTLLYIYLDQIKNSPMQPSQLKQSER